MDASHDELDDSLARTAQKSGSLRFALGVGLDALASIDDYGQERCGFRR